MARPTGSCPPGRKPLLSDRETALGRRSFRPSPCRGRHPSSPRRRGGSNIHSYFWPMWLKYSFPLVAQILVPTWLKYSLTFTQTGKTKKFPLRLPKRPLFTVVVVNSGQNTPPQSLYWWSKPVYPQTRAAEESGSFLEQDSTTVPKSAYLRFCPFGKSCWGVPSPNPAHAPCRARKEVNA